MKKRGFGAGRWNGFGGKIEVGESVEIAASRELREEVGLKATSMDKRAVLTFKFKDEPEELEVHVFAVTAWQGEQQETEEMKPSWFKLDSIPYDEMWPDDRYWLPLFLQGVKIAGKFYFEDKDNLLSYKINKIKNAPGTHK